MEENLKSYKVDLSYGNWLLWNIPSVFNTFKIQADTIYIKSIFKEFLIPKDSIIAIEHIRIPFFSPIKSVRIYHTAHNIPKCVVIDSKNNDLIQKLKDCIPEDQKRSVKYWDKATTFFNFAFLSLLFFVCITAIFLIYHI